MMLKKAIHKALYPELELFETVESRADAYRIIGGRKVYIGQFTAIIVVAVTYKAFTMVCDFYEMPEYVDFLLALLALISFVMACWLLRVASIQSSLRKQLNASGIPVCLGCGYDLRKGVECEGWCPKCGDITHTDKSGRSSNM